MKIKVVIPARYESSRLPGKPLIDLAGKPMIVRAWERVCLDVPRKDVCVATDNVDIAATCEARGIHCYMTSEDCRTGTDRVAEVASRQDESDPPVDVWVVAMGDNPLLPRGVIPAVANRLERQGPYHSGCAVIGRARLDPERVRDETTQKMVIDSEENLIYSSRRPIPFAADDVGEYWDQVNVYAFWPHALKRFAALPTGPNEARETLEILRLIEHGYKVGTVEVPHNTLHVDVPADVPLAVAACEQLDREEAC